jgi:hypothetical protein
MRTTHAQLQAPPRRASKCGFAALFAEKLCFSDNLLNIAEINENLIDVSVNTRPIPRTARIDNGQGWAIAEQLAGLLREYDATIHDNI